ncbi:MAG: type I methionyl aminopeptidase [Candidatus Margulisbacteria bacterium]|nr:type I methionyl aminopeptidase [Candidatus Margulisiibacteriota bacterium]
MAKIKIKSAEEIEIMKEAGLILGEILSQVAHAVKPGVTTEDLDSLAEKLILQKECQPVFKGYRGYKHATCISVNEEVVHGIPGQRSLKEGDIIGLDIGLKLKGFCSDTAMTVAVGKVSKKAAKLLRIGKAALKAGIKQARAGNHLGDVSAAIEKIAEDNGYSVVRDLYGHGIGRDLHEDPLIPNFGFKGEGLELKPGMVLAIEPMLNIGGSKIETLSDGWTVVTADRELSCHFEHSVLVSEEGPEILTKRVN